jgi:Fe-S cluster assembly protein SufD
MIERIREEARQRFSDLGFPTTHDEDWRFTNVAPISRATFAPAVGTGILACPLPKGVEVSKLSEAPRELLEAHLARYASFQNNAFVALNTANFQDGLLIRIPKGAVIEEPI